jgi:hypothetical protein
MCEILTFCEELVEHTTSYFIFPLVICAPVLCVLHHHVCAFIRARVSHLCISNCRRGSLRLLLALYDTATPVAQRLTLEALAASRIRWRLSLMP